MRYQKKPAGFSLIELMIVLAIIAITLTLAVPTYGSYVTRARLTELIIVSSPSKTEISEYHATTGRLPDPKEDAGFEMVRKPTALIDRILYRLPKKHTIFIEVQPGKQLRNKLKRKQAIVLRGRVDAGNRVQWDCGTYSNKARTVPLHYLPATCRQKLKYNGKT